MSKNKTSKKNVIKSAIKKVSKPKHVRLPFNVNLSQESSFLTATSNETNLTSDIVMLDSPDHSLTRRTKEVHQKKSDDCTLSSPLIQTILCWRCNQFGCENSSSPWRCKNQIKQ